MAIARAVGLVGFFILTAAGCGGDDRSSSDSTSGANGRGGSSASSSETDTSATDDSDYGGTFTAGNVTYRTEYDFELPAGFQRYTELGEKCPAAYAVDPELAAGSLEYIPCPSGIRGCEEALASSMGHTLPDEKSWSGGYEYQVAHDDAGHAAKIMSRYFDSSSDSTPYGTVVHDINSGVPLAAWRNAEADMVVRTTVIATDESAPNPALITPAPSTSTSYSPSSSRCVIHPVLANKTIWVVARASDSTELKVSHGSLSDPAATTKFVTLDANDSILGRKMLASDDALAVEQSDGRITVFYASDDSQVTFYGPAMRVWLHSVIGSDVIVYNDQGTDGVIYLRVPRDGESTQLPRSEATLRVDGTRAAWMVEQSYELTNAAVVWSAPYNSLETATYDGAVHSVPLELRIFDRPCSPILSNGMYAFLSDCSVATELTVYVVNTATGDARSITLSGGSAGYQEPRTLFAVTETHVWLATPDSLSKRHLELQRMAF